MKKPGFYLLLEIVVCLLLSLLPHLLMLWPQDAMTVLAIHSSHILYPAMALLPRFGPRAAGLQPFYVRCRPFCCI